MMDSPSLAMATGLENWPGPSPWEPHVSTYSKAGGGACCAATVCAGREQPAISTVQIETTSAAEMTLRTGRAARRIKRQRELFTGVLQPWRNLRPDSTGYPQVRERGARPSGSNDRRVPLSGRSFDGSEIQARLWDLYRLARAFGRKDCFR